MYAYGTTTAAGVFARSSCASSSVDSCSVSQTHMAHAVILLNSSIRSIMVYDD